MTPQEIVDKINDPQQLPFEVYFTISTFLDYNNDNEAVLYIQEQFNCDKDTASEVLTIFKKTLYIRNERISANSQQTAARESVNKPKCPICGSFNLSKITGAQKAMKIVAFGVFGMGDNGKTWKCNNCGSKF